MVEVDEPVFQASERRKKAQLAGELREGQSVDDIFAITDLNSPVNYKEKPGLWFSFVVADRSGPIVVRYWGGRDESVTLDLYRSLKVGQVVRIKGIVKKSKSNSLEVVVGNNSTDLIQPLSDDGYESCSFVANSEREMGEMLAELAAFIKSVSNPELRALLKSFFEEDNFMADFKKAPAAKYYHGCCVGGLIEHTLRVAETCSALARIYTDINRDLLISGALLHDIGKVHEYEVKNVIALTDNAILRGHVVTGAEMVSTRCTELSVTSVSKLKIAHMVLASHGQPQYGSPMMPSIPEAVMLHYADDLEAKMEQYRRASENANPEMSFTKDDLLGRYVFLK